jgi:hypothetical protein
MQGAGENNVYIKSESAGGEDGRLTHRVMKRGPHGSTFQSVLAVIALSRRDEIDATLTPHAPAADGTDDDVVLLTSALPSPSAPAATSPPSPGSTSPPLTSFSVDFSDAPTPPTAAAAASATTPPRSPLRATNNTDRLWRVINGQQRDIREFKRLKLRAAEHIMTARYDRGDAEHRRDVAEAKYDKLFRHYDSPMMREAKSNVQEILQKKWEVELYKNAVARHYEPNGQKRVRGYNYC